MHLGHHETRVQWLEEVTVIDVVRALQQNIIDMVTGVAVVTVVIRKHPQALMHLDKIPKGAAPLAPLRHYVMMIENVKSAAYDTNRQQWDVQNS